MEIDNRMQPSQKNHFSPLSVNEVQPDKCRHEMALKRKRGAFQKQEWDSI